MSDGPESQPPKIPGCTHVSASLLIFMTLFYYTNDIFTCENLKAYLLQIQDSCILAEKLPLLLNIIPSCDIDVGLLAATLNSILYSVSLAASPKGRSQSKQRRRRYLYGIYRMWWKPVRRLTEYGRWLEPHVIHQTPLLFAARWQEGI